MYRLPVLQKNNPEKTVVHLRDPRPASVTAVGLPYLSVRPLYRSKDPFILDHPPVWPEPYGREIFGGLHTITVAFLPEEKHPANRVRPGLIN